MAVQPAPPQVHLTHLIARLLTGEALTVSQAARGSAFGKAAVRRQLQLIANNLPGVTVGGRPATWRFQRPSSFEPVVGGAWAVAAARALIPRMGESAIGVVLEELIERLVEGGDDERAASTDLARKFFVRRLTLPADAIDTLAHALSNSHEVEAVYTHFSAGPDRVRLRPLSLLSMSEQAYCYAECVDSAIDDHLKSRRLYNLARLSEVKDTGKVFSYPTEDDYSPATVFGPSFAGFIPLDDHTTAEDVVLEFSSDWGPFLEHNKIHPSQDDAEERPDGWLRVTVHVYLLHDLVRWVRGLGNQCRVVAPEFLREWVVAGAGTEYLARRPPRKPRL